MSFFGQIAVDVASRLCGGFRVQRLIGHSQACHEDGLSDFADVQKLDVFLIMSKLPVDVQPSSVPMNATSVQACVTASHQKSVSENKSSATPSV